MYSYKCFNSSYMNCVGYETRDKLICTPGKCCITTNTTRKEVIPKTNTNKTPPSSTLGFGCSSHKDTSDIFSEYFFFTYIASIFIKKLVVCIDIYINNVKSRHGIGLPKLCG